MDRRKGEHENKDYCEKEIKVITAVECANETTAASVEDKMKQLYFDVGNPRYKGNGAAPNSRFVYLYKKPY